MAEDLTTVHMRICEPEHPHFPETGYLTGKIVTLFGRPMGEFKLDDCRHGTGACFVSHGEIARLETVSRRRKAVSRG